MHDDRPLPRSQQELGRLLEVVAQGQLDRARRVGIAPEQGRDRAQLLSGGRAGEDLRSRALDLRRAERERVVAGDVGEQVAGRVLADELDVAVGLGGHGAGDDHAVGGDDRPPRLVEVAEQLAGVVGLRLELLLPTDLPVVERREQRHVAGDEGDRELADLAIHESTISLASRRWRRGVARGGAAAMPPSVRVASGRRAAHRGGGRRRR